MTLPISPPVFALLSRLIEDRFGIHYDAADADLLADKIEHRVRERDLESLLDYYYFLRYDPCAGAEIESLIESLVVRETYLFREPDSLNALVQDLIPKRLASSRTIRLLSAACSTGEEPYTLAMMLSDAGLLERVEIVATDISPRALATGKEGVYGGRALRAFPEKAKERHTTAHGSGAVQVNGALRKCISWARLNLLDDAAVAAMGLFDFILCRNVLIYFSDETVQLVVARLAGRLLPGGILTVSVTESLLRHDSVLACEEHGGSFFYRKVTP